jgi:hypothetical protein
MAQQDGGSGFIAGDRILARRMVPRLGMILSVVVALALPARAVVVVETSTGIRAVVHTPADVVELLDTAGGRTWLRHPQAGDIELDTTRYPWDSLVPVPTAEVVAALEAMQGFTTDVDVDVFLLPGFPAGVWSSFAQGRAIFMAPAFATTEASTVHYLVTHEMGHVLTSAAFDPQPSRWAAYLDLRGLDASALDPAAAHAERAREILAEDLRYVFGGPLATLSGTIENARLPLPETVSGLTTLLTGYLADPSSVLAVTLAARAFPNPCNPQTTVELSLPAGAQVNADQAVLEIIDVRGRLVQRVRGAEVSGGVARVIWTGQDAAGRPAPSGVYVYVFRLGEVVACGRVSVVR